MPRVLFMLIYPSSIKNASHGVVLSNIFINSIHLLQIMDSRPILKDAKKIRVYLDSNTFNDLLNQKDRLAIAILNYNSECLDFVSSPLDTTYNELKNIVKYELILDDNSEIKSIKITQKESGTEMVFGYKMDAIQSIAQKIYQKDKISKKYVANLA